MSTAYRKIPSKLPQADTAAVQGYLSSKALKQPTAAQPASVVKDYKPFTDTLKRGSAAPTIAPASAAYATQKNANYDPYKPTEQIVSYKDSFEHFKSIGDVDGAEKFRTLAAPLYAELRENGYGDLANQLTASGTADSRRLLNGMQYDNYEKTTRENNNRMIDNQVAAAEKRIAQQKQETEQAYSDRARQAYISYLQQKGALPQQLKAQGITGGLSESSQVAMENSYGQQVSENQRERLKALQQLDADMETVRLDADSQKIQQENDLATQRYSHNQNQYNMDWQSEENRINREYQERMQQEQIAANAAEAQASRDWQSAETQAGREFTAAESQKDRDMQLYQFDKNYSLQEQQMAFNSYIAGKEITQQEEQIARSWALSLADIGNYGPLAAILGLPEETVAQNAEAYMYRVQEMPYKARAAYAYTGGSGSTSAAASKLWKE